MLQWSPRAERTPGAGFLIHREIAGNVLELFSISARATAVVVKLNKRYRSKIVQPYVPTASYDDDAIDCFYENVESAVRKGTTQLTVVMGD